jgi:uncharacterized membrane protein YoaK (UPF0700 family)
MAIRLRDERLREAVALAVVGGFLDAYTFLAHGGVFANAQSGNVILFGIAAGEGNWPAALRRLPPIAAFAVGILTVEAVARLRRVRAFHRPVRVVLVIEIVTLGVVGLLPSSTPDWIPAVLITWAATLQIGTFRTVNTASYTTTFTTGNLRSLLTEASAWLAEHDHAAKAKAKTLGLVVVTFALGAFLGGLATHWLGDPAVLLVLPLLVGVLASIVVDTWHAEQAPPAVPG